MSGEDQDPVATLLHRFVAARRAAFLAEAVQRGIITGEQMLELTALHREWDEAQVARDLVGEAEAMLELGAEWDDDDGQ